jgi:hypothetical protein
LAGAIHLQPDPVPPSIRARIGMSVQQLSGLHFVELCDRVGSATLRPMPLARSAT